MKTLAEPLLVMHAFMWAPLFEWYDREILQWDWLLITRVRIYLV